MNFNLNALKEAGWSPNSLAAALSLSPPNKEKESSHSSIVPKEPYFSPSKNISSGIFLDLTKMTVLSPLNDNTTKNNHLINKNTFDNTKMRNEYGSPLHSLSQKFKNSFSFNINNTSSSNSGYTPQFKSKNMKKTPSPSKFTITIDLTSLSSNKDNKEEGDIIIIDKENCVPLSWQSKKPIFQSAKDIYLGGLLQDKNNGQYNNNNNNNNKVLPGNYKVIEVTADIIYDPTLLDLPLANGWTLFPHQKEAIQLAIKNKRSILAYDMGLGKTIISIKWAEIMCLHYTPCMVVVIAPVTLLETWRREATVVGFHVISNLSEARYANKKGSSILLLASWAKIPSCTELLSSCHHQRYVVIGDESHSMQTLTSQRTQASLALCLHKSCVGSILATGTPMKNGRPANLLPLLLAIQHPISKNRIEYEKRYCNARKTRYCAWDTTGASNLEELRLRVGDSLMRKTKEECIDVPLLSREKVHCTVSLEDMTEYNRITKAMKMAGKQKGPKNQAFQDAIRGNNPLELLTDLRMLTSKAKVLPLTNIVKDLLESDKSPIVIFVNFRDSAFQLKNKLCAIQLNTINVDSGNDNHMNIKCEHLTGDIIKHEERQLLVDNFQQGKLDVLVCTFGVGSVGLTLTKSHRVILMDRPWTPGDVMQAEDRIRRIGQLHHEVNSYWITAFGFDEKLDLLLESKENNSHKVLSKVCKKKWFDITEDANTVRGTKECTIQEKNKVNDIRTAWGGGTQAKSISTTSVNTPLLSAATAVNPSSLWNIRDSDDCDEVVQSSIMKEMMQHLCR